MNKSVPIREVVAAVTALRASNTPATIKEIKRQVNTGRQGEKAPLAGLDEVTHSCTEAVGLGMITLADGKYSLAEIGEKSPEPGASKVATEAMPA